MQPLEKLYGSLDADQRFRLFMAAMARDDLAEADKIDAGCPRKTYVMEDADYLRRKQKTFIISLTHIAEVWITRCVEMSILVSVLVTEESESNQTLHKQSIELLGKLVSVRRAKAQAWNEFAKEIGIPPKITETGLSLGGSSEVMDELFDAVFADMLGDKYAPNPDAYAKHAEQLREMWRIERC